MAVTAPVKLTHGQIMALNAIDMGCLHRRIAQGSTSPREVEALERAGIIRQNDDGVYKVTDAGRVAMRASIRVGWDI